MAENRFCVNSVSESLAVCQKSVEVFPGLFDVFFFGHKVVFPGGGDVRMAGELLDNLSGNFLSCKCASACNLCYLQDLA